MVTLRRNGLPSSCEPCRKSKLRCDHQFPVCERCIRTKKADRCTYRLSPSTSTPSRKRVSKAPLVTSTPGSKPDATMIPLESSRPDRPAAKRRLSQCESFGMTSHFALFQESTDHLGASPLSLPHRDPDDPVISSSALAVESNDVRQGSHLLRLLRDLPVYRKVAEGWLESTDDGDFFGRPLVEQIFGNLEEFSGEHSSQCDSSALTIRSREIFHKFSERIPLSPSMTFQEYMSKMSCRWEIVGLVFSFVGLGAMLAENWDSMFEGRPIIPRRELAHLAMSATETCLRFCNEAGVLNDTLSWLVEQHTYCMTLIHGDRGLNQSSSDAADDPFWLIQIRRRLMGHAFSCDKQLATFLGRPPRISWRFCNISLPLDLAFSDIIAQPAVRDMALRNLDSDGWNTKESDTQAIWLRVGLIMGPVRESILELSLSQEVRDLPQRIEELVQRSHSCWASLPAFVRQIQYSEACVRVAGRSRTVFLGQLHLDYMYNQFLLYLILSKRSNIWSADLIQVSHEILSAILRQIDNRVKAMTLGPELSWIMSFFGLPVAGVLSIELVRRIPSLSMDIQNTPINPTGFSFLVLGSSRISQARGAILRVLDVVLSPEASAPIYQDVEATGSNSVTPNPFDGLDSLLDYSYYINRLDNWQFELQNSLEML
ncbi:hypothetical protein N7468_000584 [Penicillium chermesinum]|uniref:Zn(2)-C6 fungal-type domain-containing protein n=1 Tax=Penicillium chermesinum TaxID=63820 RepID=A0A9W9PKI7_9EURO|nr:uncharacterized protein N7468_000584 [Penicillium chermesinum]KAJ5249133.1 hypothetical protein N7468_000584 [Penicillium chermesinum]